MRLRALPRTLVSAGCVATLAIAGLLPDARAEDPPPLGATPERPVVVEVAGDDVNLRCGPSIDHHDVGQASRGDLLVAVGQDDEFVRVRVPGGVPVYVFGKLLEWDADDGPGGALSCTVSAADVLMRATPTTRHYPLRDQKLQRGAELLVLGTLETEMGTWLRVLTPPEVHVWIHGRYVRPVQPQPDELVLERRDELTGGRTRAERATRAAALRERFEQRFVEIAKRVGDGEHGPDVEAAARALADSTEEHALRVRALALAERIIGLREVADEERRAELARLLREADAAQRRVDELREERERLERELRRLRRRGAPAAVGIVRVREGGVVLEVPGAAPVELASSRLRLAEHAGRRVRVWGHRQDDDEARARLEVTAIEILAEGD